MFWESGGQGPWVQQQTTIFTSTPWHCVALARLSQWGKQFNVARKGSGSKLMNLKLMNLDGTVEVGVTVELAGAAELDTYRVQKDVGASWTCDCSGDTYSTHTSSQLPYLAATHCILIS
jgi:hypothetical protein